MSATTSPRRRFLQVIAQGGALAGAASLGLGCGNGPAGIYDAGAVSAVPVGALHQVGSAPLAIGHDEGGLYAMTLICPHANCDMGSQGAVSPSGVVCYCHGSSFDVTGGVLNGPAHDPLEHYAVTVSAAGEITVDADTPVDASVRAAV